MDLEEARALLRIDKHNLDEELVRQPELYYRVGQALAEAESLRDHRVTARDQLETSLLNRAAKEEGRVALDKIKTRVAEDDELRRFSGVIRSREEEVRQWRHLHEAFRQRGYMLRELVALYNANYYQRNSITYREGMDDYEKARKSLARRRLEA